MFKFAGFIFCGALMLLAGCATAPRDNGPLPKVWEWTNAVPSSAARPTNACLPPGNHRASAAPVWTSLNNWTATENLPGPKQVAKLPVATYAIKSPKGKLDLEIGSREAMWRGMEILLGFPPKLIDGQVCVRKLDLIKNLEPLLLGTPLTFGKHRVIVIDPGHGGSNTGTHNPVDGRFEKEFTLDWALQLRPLLEREGWTVLLTRTKDKFVSLPDRVAFANRHHADVFISLHFNSAAPSTTQKGLEIYCMTPTGMPSTLTRGYKDPVTDHYPNNNCDTRNLELAVRLQASLLKATGEADRGIRRARFMGVLQGQKCPAVLIEGGFLSNPAEARKIESAAFREKLAEGVAEALR